MNLINNKDITLDKMFIGTVLKIDKSSRACWVHIPELMMALPSDREVNNVYPINIKNIKNANLLNLNDRFSKGNTLKVKPFDARSKLPAIGSLVSIIFIDNNIAHGHWIHFNPNNICDYEESEKYSKLATLKVGNTSLEITENDFIDIQLPEYFETIKFENDKTKTILVRDTENDDKSISKLQESVKLMEKNFDSMLSRYKKLFIKNIKSNTIGSNELNIILQNLNNVTENIANSQDTIYDLYNIEDLYENKVETIKLINQNESGIYNKYLTILGTHTPTIVPNRDVLEVDGTFAKEIVDYENDYTKKYNDIYTMSKKLVVKSDTENILETIEADYGNEITVKDKYDEKFNMGLFKDPGMAIPYELFVKDGKTIIEESTDVYACLTSYEVNAYTYEKDAETYFIAVLEYDTNSTAEITSKLILSLKDTQTLTNSQIELVHQGNNIYTEVVNPDDINNKSKSLNISFTQAGKTVEDTIQISSIPPITNETV